MDIIKSIIDFFLHLDRHMDALVGQYGSWTYAIVTLVVFCETGLVVVPFLPGDSLLFVLGAFAAKGTFNIYALWGILAAAAIAGDALNYSVGRWLAPKIFGGKKFGFLKKEYLDQTEAFFLNYGNKTIILARFVPIVRTFAPFMAGVGSMPYAKFALYNITGGLLWVSIGLWAGYWFGGLPFVASHFSLVVLGIVVVSLIPAVVEYIKHRSA